MALDYIPYADRTPDAQYRERLKYILSNGSWKQETIQGVPQVACLTVPEMVFDLANGIPLLTERDVFFWRSAIGEICAFMNGARTQKELEAFGCPWWAKWVTAEKCADFGLEPGDLGQGSYGPAFHDFPMADGGSFNQFAAIAKQIRERPFLATHEITPWVPFWTASGQNRKVVVAPCHGWLHFEILDGKLHMKMRQRSADFPVGVPANMIQYAALLMMMAQVTGYEPGMYIHQFTNAHIYADQLPHVYEMIHRQPRRLPTLAIDESVDDLFAFRKEHFALSDYHPHPRIDGIPVAI